jgi:hypothetical protein
LKVINPQADTVENWVLSEFSPKRIELGQQLAEVKTIHLSFDASSWSGLGLVGVVAHWSTQTGCAKRALLALREAEGGRQHTASWVAQVWNHYGLSMGQIGYYVVDNVNDTEPNVVESGEDSKRLPSLGNIFNLVLEALLSTDEIGENSPILAPIRMIQTILQGTSRLSKSLLRISR